MWFFKSKADKELDKLMKKLTRIILNSDQMKLLVTQARKQMEFDELQFNKLNFPIIQDLINTATNGVNIDIRLSDNTTIQIKPDVENSDAYKEKLLAIKRESQKEYY